jgi:hypothetical protein
MPEIFSNINIYFGNAKNILQYQYILWKCQKYSLYLYQFVSLIYLKKYNTLIL